MKIIYFANARLPTEKAHGIQIMKMSEAFADLGHDFELVVPARRNFMKEDLFDYYGVKRNFKIRKIFCLDTISFGLIGFLIQWFSFCLSAMVLFFYRRANVFLGRDYLVLTALSFFGKNVCWESHTGQWNFIVSLYAKKLNNKMIVISHGLKNFYISKGVKGENVFVAQDGVDLAQFQIDLSKDQARKKFDFLENNKIVMYTGALGLWKGVATLLEASKMFKSEVQLVVLGGREREIEKLKIDYPKVVFLGSKPYKDIPIYQKMADVFVLPNTGKDKISVYFTSPLKLFSYLASGAPSVVSDLPSIREVVSEKEVVFFKPDDPKSLAEGVHKLIYDQELSDRLSKNSMERVKEYTWAKRAYSILRFIHEK